MGFCQEDSVDIIFGDGLIYIIYIFEKYKHYIFEKYTHYIFPNYIFEKCTIFVDLIPL